MPATACRITDLRDLDAAFTIRSNVFVEGQGVPAALENDVHDRTDARHYLARTADGTPAGAARWRETENGVKLERFAVLEAFRNQAIGATILHAVLADVRAELPGARVYLNAQINAVRFYERYGFHKAGEVFEEAGIQHFQMVL